MSETETPEQPELTAEEQALEESRVIRERMDKAEKLRAGGMNLYAQRYNPTHSVRQVRENQEALIASGENVILAGRALVVRSFGKAGFITFSDQSGKFQAYVKKDVSDAAGFEFFKHGLDAGDIIGAEGPVFVTKTGELSVEARRLVLLTKSVRPLPGKWHGLRDMELRYRRRYVDLIVNEDVRRTFETRSRIISTLRSMLDAKGYMEVETPMMQTIYGGAAAKPFRTHHNALDLDLYLRIAPELFLKRLVAGGLEKVYEINRNFRNEGLSTRHNPEFTMLELYTAWWDYNQTLELTEELVRETARRALGTTVIKYQGREVDFAQPFRRLPILAGVAAELGFDESAQPPFRWGLASLNALREILETAPAKKDNVKAKAIEGALHAGKTTDEALIHLFESLVEPNIVHPTFMTDFPKSLCPLAKSSESDPATAERFELFICGLETANAYSELNDPAEQLARFQEQVGRRAAGDEEAMNEVDMDYVHALEYGMAPCSGLGIGIDRLVMLMTDSASIRDVILFPLMRPHGKG